MQLKFVAKILSGALAAGMTGFVISEALLNPYFDIHSVDITAKADSVTMLEIHNVINKSLQGNFFTVDIENLRRNLQQLSWIKHVEVNRVWPDRLAVEIINHRPIAIWDDGRLVSDEGIVFSSADEAIENLVELPLFGGDISFVKEAVHYLPEFSKAAQLMRGRLKSVKISFRGSWSVVIESKYYPDVSVELGRATSQTKPVERLRRAAMHFDEMTNTMMGYTSRIDTRYPSSLAVKRPSKENYNRWASDHKKELPFPELIDAGVKGQKNG